MIELYDYQKEHADRLRKALLSYGVAKDASDTGTGKTFTACHVADSLEYSRVVVLCPKAVIPAWKKAMSLTKYSDKEIFVVNYELVRTGNHALLIRKNKTFRWNTPRTTLFIFDEDHKVSGRMSLNGRMLTQAVSQRYDMLLLGATSFTSPLQLNAIGYALGLHKGYRNFVEWLTHVGCYKDIWNAWQPPKNNQEVLEKLNKFIFPERGSRMAVKDIPSFPENKIIIDSYYVEAPEKVANLYADIREKYDQLNERKLDDGDSFLTEVLRQRQEIELAKIPSVLDLIQSDLKAGKRVAVFVNFRDTQTVIRERLRKIVPIIAEIHGDQTGADRERAITLFQNNEVPVIISTISAGGVGISLHDLSEDGSAPRSSVILPSFNAVDLRQALGRIHRAGQRSKSLQRIVLASDTIEESVAKRLNTKLNAFDTINDTDLNPFIS